MRSSIAALAAPLVFAQPVLACKNAMAEAQPLVASQPPAHLIAPALFLALALVGLGGFLVWRLTRAGVA